MALNLSLDMTQTRLTILFLALIFAIQGLHLGRGKKMIKLFGTGLVALTLSGCVNANDFVADVRNGDLPKTPYPGVVVTVLFEKHFAPGTSIDVVLKRLKANGVAVVEKDASARYSYGGEVKFWKGFSKYRCVFRAWVNDGKLTKIRGSVLSTWPIPFY